MSRFYSNTKVAKELLLSYDANAHCGKKPEEDCRRDEMEKVVA